MIEGLPLGGLKDEKFTMLKKSFQKGDVLVMLSDGLPEASDENNEMYDYDRIVDLITKNYTKEPEEIKAEFFKSLNSWLNGGIPDDDVTLVIVKKVA
jgi:serine phosphatase RsbU (regulator of sigma subunit)